MNKINVSLLNRIGKNNLQLLEDVQYQISQIQKLEISGRVQSITGIALGAIGLEKIAKIGQWCYVNCTERRILAEVIATSSNGIILLPFGHWTGVAIGDQIDLLGPGGTISPDDSWIGCVINGLGKPLVTSGNFTDGRKRFSSKSNPPSALDRHEIGEKLETQIKCVDLFLPICRGQRMGIFAGSGVGKSTLIAMFARNTNADVVVIALVGERGREVQEFIKNDLGEDGMARSVLVVSTGDEPPLQRRQAAYTATTVAEYFRKKGLQVLLLFDSVTRFAMAQREIGLASGEPPTTKGYPPSVYSELSHLLERSGPGLAGEGDITAIYTVLVDGDDFNEPITDTVRGIVDGHIVLDRNLAEKHRYPAIDIQKSISRMLPDCHSGEEYQIMLKARQALSKYDNMADLIQVGAYRSGSDPELDSAIKFYGMADVFLSQRKSEKMDTKHSFAEIYRLLLESGIEVKLTSENSDARI
jgi:flagellum-specific ATP synthase